MATRPRVPQFPANDSSLTNLQDLSSSVSFVGAETVGWHFYQTIDQALLAGVAATITWNSVAFDPDGTHTANGASINTRGYYDCEATIPYSNTSAAGKTAWADFQITTGANNPLGSGVTVHFGRLSDLTSGNADEMSYTIYGTTPICLFPADLISVVVNVGFTNVTVSHNFNNSGNNDLGGFPDGGMRFTGIWISEGP